MAFPLVSLIRILFPTNSSIYSLQLSLLEILWFIFIFNF